MRYFQTNRGQLLRGIYRNHVVISIFLISLTLFTYSCKSLRISEDERYHTINVLLDTYTNEKDSVYLYPKIIKPQGYLIRDFLKTYRPENNYFDKCGDSIKNIVLNNEALTYYKNVKYDYEDWKYSKITNPKVFTELELKRPESIARYKQLSETIKDEEDLLARRFMLWGYEHRERMIRLSQPFFSKQNKNYAICFVSELHEGDFAWIFHKKKKQWIFVCKLRLNYH